MSVQSLGKRNLQVAEHGGEEIDNGDPVGVEFPVREKDPLGDLGVEAAVVSAPLVEVSGRVGVPELFDTDIVLAIDLSQTTLFASGIDLDGDGVTGSTWEWAREKKLIDRHHKLWTSDPDDTVIHSDRGRSVFTIFLGSPCAISSRVRSRARYLTRL